MADQGAIAELPGTIALTIVALRAPLFAANGSVIWADHRLTSINAALRAPAFLFRGATMLLGVQERLWPGGRDDLEGSPTPPSLRVVGGGVMHFRLPVDTGVRALSVKCRETSTLVPRPVLRVRSNVEVGLQVDLEATAPSGVDWVTVGPLTFTASAKGGIAIELLSFSASWEGECHWDNLLLT